jgi:acetoin:2,6-dichlorophenolindophenol oxidoreductase subunit beta
MEGAKMVEQAQEMNYKEGLNYALAEEMERDPSVIIIGEEVGIFGGNFQITAGLYDQFGGERVRSTPISEPAIVGAAVGAALAGLRPVAELMYGGFICTAFDAVFMKMGTWRQRFGDDFPLPVVLRMPMGVTAGGGIEHSFNPEALLCHCPGLKVVTPATPSDARGLLKSAIRDDGPVVFLENLNLYGGKRIQPKKRVISKAQIEEGLIPLGKAAIRREGSSVTLVTYSAMVFKSLAAAEKLSGEGIQVEVIDLRTLVPLDEEMILNSVKKTGRLLIVHEAMERGGFAGEIAMRVMNKGFDYLDAPIRRVGALNVVQPNNATLERLCVPTEESIYRAVKEIA